MCPPSPIAFERATSTSTRARLVRDVVEVALRVGVPVVDRRRQHAVVERERAHHRLERAGGAEAVARHRLRRGDGEPVGVVAEDLLERARLGEVAERRRGAVGVDVADPLRRDPGRLERRRDHRRDTGRLGLGLREVVRVVRGAVAEHLGVDRRAARAAPPRAPRARGCRRPPPSRSPRAWRRTGARRASGPPPRRRARASRRSRRGSAG